MILNIYIENKRKRKRWFEKINRGKFIAKKKDNGEKKKYSKRGEYENENGNEKSESGNEKIRTCVLRKFSALRCSSLI